MSKLEVSMEQGLAADALDKSTVEQVIDPKALEQAMIEKELNKAPDEEQIAMMALKMYTPIFQQMCGKLGARQLRRVLKGLVEYPFRDYKHTDKNEAQAFAVGQALMDARMVLVIRTYSENASKIEALAAEAKANSTLTFGNEEQEEKNDG